MTSGPESRATADSWSTLVTEVNAVSFPATDGFRIPTNRVHFPDDFWATPVGFDPRRYEGIGPAIRAVSDRLGENQRYLSAAALGLTYYEHPLLPPQGVHYLFQHRKGGQPDPEGFLRILRVDGSPDGDDRPVEFRYGEHPEHPGQSGYYLGAYHVGKVGLAAFTYPARETPELLSPEEVAFKYFPIGPAAQK